MNPSNKVRTFKGFLEAHRESIPKNDYKTGITPGVLRLIKIWNDLAMFYPEMCDDYVLWNEHAPGPRPIENPFVDEPTKAIKTFNEFLDMNRGFLPGGESRSKITPTVMGFIEQWNALAMMRPWMCNDYIVWPDGFPKPYPVDNPFIDEELSPEDAVRKAIGSDVRHSDKELKEAEDDETITLDDIETVVVDKDNPGKNKESDEGETQSEGKGGYFIKVDKDSEYGIVVFESEERPEDIKVADLSKFLQKLDELHRGGYLKDGKVFLYEIENGLILTHEDDQLLDDAQVLDSVKITENTVTRAMELAAESSL